MKFLSLVLKGCIPINATILDERGQVEALFYFPVKIAHYKFLYNGFFFTNSAIEVTVDQFRDYLKRYEFEEVIVFKQQPYEFLSSVLKRLRLVELSFDAVTDPAHYTVKYHTMVTCSYCLARTYASVYLKQLAAKAATDQVLESPEMHEVETAIHAAHDADILELDYDEDLS